MGDDKDENKLTFEQRQEASRNFFRQILAVLYMVVFLPSWFIFLYIMVTEFDLSVLEGIGLGTANGIFLTAFALMWQFFYRKGSVGRE